MGGRRGRAQLAGAPAGRARRARRPTPPPLSALTPVMAAASLTAPSGPASTTRVGSDDWSIWIVAPVYTCSALIVSPARPMTRPTRARATWRTVAVAPGEWGGGANVPSAG